MTRITLVLLCFISLALSGFGQGDYSTDIRCGDWQARQIGRMPADREGSPSPVAYFRREFTLDHVPATAVLHLTADRSCKVYVNGTFVGDGPPRTTYGTPGIYCSYDITSLLAGGANALAIMAFIRGGDPEISGQLEFRDTRGRIMDVIVTDESWKARASPWGVVETTKGPGGDFMIYSGNQWVEQVPWISEKPGGDFTEIFDGRREPGDWRLAGFDDRNWGGVQSSPARGYEASSLPHHVRDAILPQKVVFKGEVTDLMGSSRRGLPGIQMAMEIPLASKHTKVVNAEGLLGKTEGATMIENEVDVRDQASYDTYWDKHEDMPMLRAATVILDFGEIANAYVEIDIEGASGTVVDIGWGQTLVDGRVHTMPRFFSKDLITYASRYLHGGGRQQWETCHWQNFRYLQLTIRNQSGPVRLHHVAALRSGQPMKQAGKFKCSDPLINKIYQSGIKTLRAASYDMFLDNSIREKEPWGGSIAECAVSTCLAALGDIPMLRYYFEQFGKTQKVIGTGNLPQAALSTNARYMSLALRTAAWMAEYGYWCSEPEYYGKTIWPILEWYLDYLESRAENRGLLTTLDGEVDWVDWARGQRKDLSIPVNLFYLNLLDRASSMARAYGKENEAGMYDQRAAAIRNAISEEFWDEQSGLYRDGSYRGELCPGFSTQANYLALLCGLGQDERAERMLDALLDPGQAGELIRFTPSFLAVPPAALFGVGKSQAALDLMRNRYARFYRNPDGNETFWEEWSWALGGNSWGPRYRSMAQNEFGIPCWLMITEILGVKPLKTGFKEFAVEPKPCDLEWAEGVVPSPAGDIPVRWEMDDGKMKLNIIVPEGTKTRVTLPGSGKAKILGPGEHNLNP